MSTSTLPPLSETELRSIETLYRAFTEQNPDLLDQALAPDWQDIPLAPGQGPGPAGLKGLLPGFFAAFPDLKVTIDEIIGHSGKAGVRAKITATHLGDFLGVAPTGKPVTVALHEFHHLKDGRITHTWHLEDWFGMLNQISAWPPSA
ncbi:MAG: ester cyclase [Akkermansiaceae bacterium]|nr:ester cyclase [Akkermansiaceae bacterium]